MNKSILIVDDEPDICDLVTLVLTRAGFQVSSAHNANDLFAQLQKKPDLILMDWMIGADNGVDLARQLRQMQFYQDIPIIMLTARSDEDDKVRALELAVDDYLTKPFSPRELTARIQAVLRRLHADHSGKVIHIGHLQIETAKHRVSVDHREIKLSPIEYKLLYFFATHQDRVYSRAQIIDAVWSTNSYLDERSVDVQIRRLRKALVEHGQEELIQTVRTAGYIMVQKK